MSIRFSLGLLLALLIPNGDLAASRFVHLSPTTLERIGPQLHVRLDPYSFHAVDAGSGRFVTRTKDALQVFDSATLRLVRSYPFRARDVCAVGLDAATPVALVGCTSQTSRQYAVIRFDVTPLRIPVRRAIAAIRYPVSMAFGDGHVYVVRAFGAVDAIDLRSGSVSSHAPKRTLAKGEGYVRAEWLGDHLLGAGGTVVDVRTWHRRTLAPHATETVAAGDKIATVGPNGVNVYTKRDLRLYRRLFRGEVIDSALFDGNVLYVQSALVWYVVDVPTGRTIARLVPSDSQSLQLLAS